MQGIQAHLVCAVLLAADLAARSIRLRALTVGAGCRLSSPAALGINLLADAGAAITPMRFGGEPARVAGLASAGVRMPAIAATIGWELVTAWPTVASRATQAWPVLVIAAVLGVASLIAAQRLRTRMSGAVASRLDAYTAPWRGMPPGALVTSVVCSMVNVATRTAMLPILALSLPTPPDPAAVWLGSFLLSYW